ncbi:MAG TPA: hypothetical protein VLL27_08125 [Solirubrobacterales bacterium]|nr:hypothetical protein [Solirubrobacterales bacterium]
MRAGLRISSGVLAPVAAVLALGGCGGGSGATTDQVSTLGLPICDVSEAEGALTGLEAGIDGIGRGNERQTLRAMKENAASIRGQLPMLEDCARNALLEAEGKPVHETAPLRPPARRTVVGHRLGSARVEPGGQGLPASPCGTFGRNGTTTVHIFSDAPHCSRVAPGERLLFVNDTGIGPRHAGGAAVRVLVGDYELWIGLHGSGLIPAPVETYLGRGSHRVRIAGAPGATILLLPPVCAMRPPAAPGEELCFR